MIVSVNDTAIVDWSREEVNEAAGHLQSINLDVCSNLGATTEYITRTIERHFPCNKRENLEI